ncbi:MAG: hypothetical protein WAV67_14270 [Dokdonella sp.]
MELAISLPDFNHFVNGHAAWLFVRQRQLPIPSNVVWSRKIGLPRQWKMKHHLPFDVGEA